MKNWRAYLLESLMIFLAVFLGFLADERRENSAERGQERQYIQSMLGDLKSDLDAFDSLSNERKISLPIYDSLIFLLNKKGKTTPAEQQHLYFYARLSILLGSFITLNDRTYEQMRSSGNLRLIQNEKVAEAVSKYYYNSKDLSAVTNQILSRRQHLVELHGKIFDGNVFSQIFDWKKFKFDRPSGNPQLITTDRTTVNELIMAVHYLASISAYTNREVNRLRGEANQLIALLEKEYQLDKK